MMYVPVVVIDCSGLCYLSSVAVVTDSRVHHEVVCV